LFRERLRRRKSVAETKVDHNKRREQFMLYAPLLIWIGVIFFLSSSQGASTQTSLIIRPILEFLFPDASFETIAFYHGIIRKFAHLTEYAILGFLAARAFFRSHSNFLRNHFWWMAILLVLFVASSDEFNQSFNPDRTSSPVDVLIDLTGGITSALIYSFATRRRRHAGSR
jgi:VanZ family protein